MGTATVGNKGKRSPFKVYCRYIWQVAVICGKLPLYIAAALA